MRNLASLALAALIVAYVGQGLSAQQSMEELFEAKYQRWSEFISRPEVMAQSVVGPRFECSQFQEIVDLGLQALPYIVRKMKQNPEDRLLWKAIEEIAKVRIRGKYDREKNKVVFPQFPDLKPGERVYLYWWREGHKFTPERFETLYVEWRQLKGARGEEEAGAIYRRMVDLGVTVLPSMMKRIERGDSALVAVVSYLTDGAIDHDATPQQCINWWQRNEKEWTIPFGSGAEPDTTE